MVARGDGMCCSFVSLTAGKRAALPSPAGDHEGHPYESSGLLPLFMASVDAYWATARVAPTFLNEQGHLALFGTLNEGGDSGDFGHDGFQVFEFHVKEFHGHAAGI